MKLPQFTLRDAPAVCMAVFCAVVLLADLALYGLPIASGMLICMTTLIGGTWLMGWTSERARRAKKPPQTERLLGL